MSAAEVRVTVVYDDGKDHIVIERETLVGRDDLLNAAQSTLDTVASRAVQQLKAAVARG